MEVVMHDHSPGLPPVRRGITLLEVLISIGILAIGLSSVVALVPAGQSQASRAVILDRGAVLAANAVADAATFGLLRQGTAVLSVSASASVPVIVDPAAGVPYLLLASGTLAPLALLSQGGVAAPPAGPVLPAVLKLVTELRDDVSIAEPIGPDDPPRNLFVDGARAYQGRMTCLLSIRPGVSAGDPGILSAVVFHARATTSPLAVTGTLGLPSLVINQGLLNGTQLDGRSMRDVIKPGVVLWDPAGSRFHQVAAAAYDLSGTSAFLTLRSGATPASPLVQFLPDSIGLAERPYIPESVSAYTR